MELAPILGWGSAFLFASQGENSWMKDSCAKTPMLAFARTWDLRQTMAFEAAYHPNLRLSLPEKIALLKGAECVWLYDAVTRKLIGETYGLPVRKAIGEGEEGFADIRPYWNRKAIYVFSTTILPGFQRKGFGRILKAFFLGVASQAGFPLVLGHARRGGSVHLNATFGAQIGTAHPDWFETGETYYFYTLAQEVRRNTR